MPFCNTAFLSKFLSLPPANEVWGKVIFSEACVKNSVHGGGGVCLSACWGAPLWDQEPPQDRHPPRDQAHPPGPGTPPSRSRACWEIRSTSGWYASYWNAFFFLFVFTDDSDDSDSDASSDDSEFRSSSSFNTTGELELSVAAVTSAALKSKKRKKNPDG